MFSRISKVVLLAGCLTLAGGASAYERKDIIVPVIAGVAVGVLLSSAFNDRDDDRHRRDHRREPRVVYYQPRPTPHHRYRHGQRQIHYVAVPVREGRHHHRNQRRDRHDYRDRRDNREYREYRRY